jgi:hypothetical protein
MVKTKYWKCPNCGKKVIASERAKEQHLIDDINYAYEQEMEWYEIGVEAKNLYIKLFKKEP